MTIYTRTGDSGQTSLVGGERVDKNDPRVEAVGDVDEINAAIGLAISLLGEINETADIARLLQRLQNELLDLGAELASLGTKRTIRQQKATTIPMVTAAKVAWLETAVDLADEELTPLTQFILPGGHPAASALHVARTICRRAERAVARVAKEQMVSEELLGYVNRLSDLLFTLARLINGRVGVDEVGWGGHE